MGKVLIIIPTFNEKDNVRPIAAAVFAAVPDVEILFVDDNSPDGTGELLDELAGEEARVHVLHRKDKQGLGRAYIAGFQWALERDVAFIFEMDADFSHDPHALSDLLAAAQTADLVLGTRYQGGVRVVNWPLSRLILSMGAGVYVRWITGMPFSDPTGGFKCFRREVLESIDLDTITSNGYSFQIEMTHRAWMTGFKITEVPFTFIERREGDSKMNAQIVREALGMVWKLLYRSGMHRRPRQSLNPRSVTVA